MTNEIKIGSFTVHRIGLGTNRITGTEHARAVLLRAAELGVNFIDTADIYQRGHSEQTIGETFQNPYPDGPLIATKGGMSWQDSSAINDPDYLRHALEASLKRLGRATTDLYQLHRTDPNLPVEQTATVLKELKDRGNARHIGLSEVTVEQIERYRSVVEIVSVQNQYNIFERKHEAVLDYCERNNIVFIPWYPLAKGRLEDAAMTRIAKAHAATPVQIAIAWLLQRSPVILPIPGTLSIEHLERNVAAATIALSEEEFHALDALSR